MNHFYVHVCWQIQTRSRIYDVFYGFVSRTASWAASTSSNRPRRCHSIVFRFSPSFKISTALKTSINKWNDHDEASFNWPFFLGPLQRLRERRIKNDLWIRINVIVMFVVSIRYHLMPFLMHDVGEGGTGRILWLDFILLNIQMSPSHFWPDSTTAPAMWADFLMFECFVRILWTFN